MLNVVFPSATVLFLTKVVFDPKVAVSPKVPMISISTPFLNKPIASLPLKPVIELLELSTTPVQTAKLPLPIT